MRPACSQCLYTGRNCPGYHQSTKFVYHSNCQPGQQPLSIRSSECDKRQHRQARLQNASPRRYPKRGRVDFLASPVLDPPPEVEDIKRHAAVIIRHLTPDSEMQFAEGRLETPPTKMCGSWVLHLPQITGQSTHCAEALVPVLRVTSLAILMKVRPESATISEIMSCYSDALGRFRKVLSHDTLVSHDELLVSGMCLALTEVGKIAHGLVSILTKILTA